jgi:hypothetical protein
MPQSIYDNGGMIGVTLDFGDTDSYVIDPGVPANLQYVGGFQYKTPGTANDIDVIALTDPILSGGIASSVSPGDIALVFFATNPDDTGQISYRIQDDADVLYTQLADVYTLDTERVQLQVGYKIMGAGSEEVIINNGSQDADQAAIVIVHVFRGVDTSNPIDVAVQTSSTANTVIPSPSSITPVTDGSLIVVGGAGGHNRNTGAYTAPYLTNFIETTQSDTHDVTLGVGWSSWAGGAFSPAQFGTNMDNSTAFASAAVTIALRPAFTPAVLGNKKNSGIWSLSAVLESIAPSALPSSIYGVQSTQAFVLHQTTGVSATMILGTAHLDREIWVAIPTLWSSSANATVASVSIGGNSATLVGETTTGGYLNGVGVSYWKYVDNGALGTSATITTVFNNQQAHSAYIVFTTSSSSLIKDYYGSSANNSLATSGSITTDNGWAFYVAATQNASSGTIANFDNDGTFDMGSDEWVTYGFVSPTSPGTISVVSPTGALSTTNNVISAIAVS